MGASAEMRLQYFDIDIDPKTGETVLTSHCPTCPTLVITHDGPTKCPTCEVEWSCPNAKRESTQ